MPDINLALSREKADLLYRILEPMASARPIFIDLIRAINTSTQAPPAKTPVITFKIKEEHVKASEPPKVQEAAQVKAPEPVKSEPKKPEVVSPHKQEVDVKFQETKAVVQKVEVPKTDK